jgi:DNA mismatch endonuclease (patch repair protein)
MVFAKYKTVVFVDGDFWHGRQVINKGMKYFSRLLRTPNKTYWIRKLERNIKRDQDVTRLLRKAGWRVIRVWESDTRKKPELTAKRIASRLRR